MTGESRFGTHIVKKIKQNDHEDGGKNEKNNFRSFHVILGSSHKMEMDKTNIAKKM